jgi:signal transduction histidine kinase
MPLNDSLVLLQTFTGVLALMSLTLAAASAERLQAERTLRTQVHELAALNDAGRHFLERVDKQGLYGSICRLAVESFGLSAAWIHLVASKEGGAEVVAGYPPPLASPEHVAALYTACPALAQQLHTVEQARKPLVVNERVALEPGPALHTLAALPLEYRKQIAGTLTVASDDPTHFAEEHMLLLQSYCTLAAAALQNAYLFDQVRIGNVQLHALSRRLMDVQEAERIALSRELHDESSQVLAVLSVNLGLLERDAETPALVRAHAADLKQIATVVLNNLHAQAAKLRPASLDHLGLVAALQQYIREFNRQHELDVQFETVGMDGVALPAEVQTALFRIVQESLTNVALHAQARSVDVLLNWRSGLLVLTVEDDGVGFNPDEQTHPDRLGLFGMRERVEQLGGRLVVESAPGKGTIVSAEVPCGDTPSDRG